MNSTILLKQYVANAKILFFFLFNFPLSLSLSLSLLSFLSHPLPPSYHHRSRHYATDLKSPSRSLSHSHSKPLSLSHFRLSISLPTLYLSPFWLLISGCGSANCVGDGIQILCFFSPPVVVDLFNFYLWLFFEMIFVANLVGFWWI